MAVARVPAADLARVGAISLGLAQSRQGNLAGLGQSRQGNLGLGIVGWECQAERKWQLLERPAADLARVGAISLGLAQSR